MKVDRKWTLEQAQIAQKDYFASVSGSLQIRNSPLVQWRALNELESERMNFEAGDNGALLKAIAICAWHDFVMPA